MKAQAIYQIRTGVVDENGDDCDLKAFREPKLGEDQRDEGRIYRVYDRSRSERSCADSGIHLKYLRLSGRGGRREAGGGEGGGKEGKATGAGRWSDKVSS